MAEIERNLGPSQPETPPAVDGEVELGHALRYDTEVDLSYSTTSQAKVVMMAGWDRKVLEFGPATGPTTKVLKGRGCRVTGVELDPAAAEIAAQYCERIIVGDVERLDLEALLEGEKFDVVIFADVLEHLADPGRVLRRVRGLLATGGYVCASIPNVAHGSIRLSLLAGDFRYTEWGLLDRTHLRFFDRRGVDELFTGSGYTVGEWDRVAVDVFSTEKHLSAHNFPPKLLDAVAALPDCDTYQFIVKAMPAPDVSLVTPAEEVPQTTEIPFKPLWDLEMYAWEREVAADAFYRTVEGLREALAETRAQLGNVQHAYDEIVNRTNYKLWRSFVDALDKVAPWGTRRRRLILMPGYGVRILMERGAVGFVKHVLKVWEWGPKLLRKAIHTDALPSERYEAWERMYVLSPEHVRRMVSKQKTFAYKPLVSIVMPVYETDPQWLRPAIDSVISQIYPSWELCIADDGSKREDTRALLDEYARADPRIKVTHLDTNQGITAASSAGLAMATGEYAGFLDHDDELKPNALYQVVKTLNENRDLDYLYSDLDHRSEEGELKDPFRKPDFSPDYLMSCNYVTHFSVYSKRILDRVGGFRPGFDGSQDWDLTLRVTEATDKIAHIRACLYTWRQISTSVAHSDDQKPWAHDSARRAIADSLARRGVKGTVEDGPYLGYYRVRYAIEGQPKVSIIIPTRDRVDLLAKCIESIRKRSTWRNYEIVVVDNGSTDESTLTYLETYGGRAVSHPGEFNFSALINHGAREATGEYLLLLNNDTEVIEPGWIEALLEHAQRPEVGVAGARLLFPDGKAQHEGVIVGPGDGLAGNIDFENYFGLGRCIHNASAVTAACCMVRKSVFEELGGFEEALTVAYNDVDFCLRAGEKGYRILFTPYSLLWHYEAASRGTSSYDAKAHPVADEEFFRARWYGYLDPFDPPSLKMDLPLIPTI